MILYLLTVLFFELLLALALSACTFGYVGFLIGGQKNAARDGFWLGTLLGPFGLIAAFFVDRRPRCCNCGGPIDVRDFRPRVCRHCGVRLDWSQD